MSVGQKLYNTYCVGSTIQLLVDSCYECLNNYTLWDEYTPYVQTPLAFCGYDVPGISDAAVVVVEAGTYTTITTSPSATDS